jgi:hypothetical protein
MRPNAGTTELAATIERRSRASGAAPLALFLGAGCARAAGVPSAVEMARELFARLEGHDLAKKYLPSDTASDDELTSAFGRLLADLPDGQRASLLLGFYGAAPVPLFYQELAMLIGAGFFRRILTTNVDSLLERALQNAGLRDDQEYRIILLDGTTAPPSDQVALDERVAIVKLHGDISSPRFAIGPDEVANALRPRRRDVKGELGHDLLMVGYEFESPLVTEWLAYVPGKLWWVAEQRPPAREVAAVGRMRDIRYVDGPSATPQAFFGELAMLLLQMPSLNLLRAPEATPTLASRADGRPADTSPPEDEAAFEREYLRGQLRRSEELLRRLEQLVGAGPGNERLNRQLEYQKDLVADLEARLRTLGGERERVLGLLDEISESATRGRESDTAVQFLRDQVEAVRGQYGGRAPDEAVVSAILSATLVIGDRLGVDRKLLRRLAEFAPTATRSTV